MEHEKIHLYSDPFIVIRGGGELASAVAHRLFSANLKKILILESANPMCVRRRVCFAQAVFDRSIEVQGVVGRLIANQDETGFVWEANEIPILIDPEAAAIGGSQPDVLIDAIMAKDQSCSKIDMASLVIGLGPGFESGKDAHYLIETQRGHDLGKIISSGKTRPDDGIPGIIGGYGVERLLRAMKSGVFTPIKSIGDLVKKGDVVGMIDGQPLFSEIDGCLRGLLNEGIEVTKGVKLGDVDPRADPSYCNSISDRSRCVSGAVLELIVRHIQEE